MSINYGALAGIAALSSAMNFAGGITASNVSSKKAKGLAAYQAQLNYDYNKKWSENGPSYTRAGLVNAGYNPMLAVQNGVSGANASFASPNTANDVDLGLGSGLSNAMQFQNIQNQTEQTASNIKLNDAQSRNAVADAISKEIHNDYLPEREKRELGQISAQTDKLIRETSFYDELADNMESERRLQELGIYVDYAGRLYTADKAYNASTYHSDTLKDIAEGHSPSGKSVSFSNYANGVSNVLNGVGHVLHGYNESIDSNSSNDSETVYYDKNGNVRGSVSHKGKSNSRSNKRHKRR